MDQTDDSDLNNIAVTHDACSKIAFDTTATIACRWLQVAAGGYRWLQVAAGGCIEYCYYKRGGECGIIETAVRIFDLSEKKTKVRI